MRDFAEMIRPGEAWGLIPARGGSKSIPLKNLHPLAGRSLMDYVVGAGKACDRISRLVCSTDDERISRRCESMGVEVHRRSRKLAGDLVRMEEVMREALVTLAKAEDTLPDFTVLLMPTSPFVTPEQIGNCVRLLVSDPGAGSAQTVVEIPHVYHAYNQRIVEGGQVRFAFPEERRRGYNKQTKPRFFAFGNVVVMRTSVFLASGDLFSRPSLSLEIDRWTSLDVDSAQEFDLAECYIRLGFVEPNILRADLNTGGKTAPISRVPRNDQGGVVITQART